MLANCCFLLLIFGHIVKLQLGSDRVKIGQNDPFYLTVSILCPSNKSKDELRHQCFRQSYFLEIINHCFSFKRNIIFQSCSIDGVARMLQDLHSHSPDIIIFLPTCNFLLTFTFSVLQRVTVAIVFSDQTPACQDMGLMLGLSPSKSYQLQFK